MEATSVSANVCQICIKGISDTITQSRVIFPWERKYSKIVIIHLYAAWIRSVCSIGRIISVADKPFNVCNLSCKYMYLIPRKQVEYFYSNLMCKNSLTRNTFAYSHCVVNKYIIRWLNIARKLLTNACIVRFFSSQWPRMASESKTMSSKFQIQLFLPQPVGNLASNCNRMESHVYCLNPFVHFQWHKKTHQQADFNRLMTEMICL